MSDGFASSPTRIAGDMAGALAALSALALALPAQAPPLSPTPPPLDANAAATPAPARTVTGAITRAEALGAIDTADGERHRLVWRRAKRAAERLPAGRREIVAGAMSTARRIAAGGRLAAGRLAPVLAGVEASTRLASTAPTLPAAGGRLHLPGDSAVYSYRPPAGIQLHPLGTIGKLNALASACTARARRRGWHCRRRALRGAADRLIALSVPSGRALRFEYLFAFAEGRPGWISAMTQATGAQALARTYAVTGDVRYRRAAQAAYRGLVSPAGGAAVRRRGRVVHLAMYAFDPGLRVLNGEEQALIGLADYARLTRDRAARRVARRAARELASRLPGFDTGAWTLYSLGGREADLNYHDLAAGFAGGLCERGLERRAFCPAAARYARYTREPPRLRLVAVRRVRAPRRVTIVLSASKQTAARLAIRDAAGRIVLSRSLALGRGGARIVVPLRRPGRRTVTLDARAVNGRSARADATVTALPPRPRRHGKRTAGRRRQEPRALAARRTGARRPR